MSWLALFLIGIGTVDLAHSLLDRIRPLGWLPEAVGAAVVVAFGLLSALFGGDLAAIVIIAGLAVLWGALVYHDPRRSTREGWALALLGVAVVLGVLLAPAAGDVAGPVKEWCEHAPWRWVATTSPDAVLLAAGGVLVQVSTGNQVVRLVLGVSRLENPADEIGSHLKGGRILGPLERLLLLGFGLTGTFTAVAAVIAAKGFIRWPELQSIGSAPDQPSINDVTEYFLIGSFVSWATALGTLALVVA